MTTGTLDLQQVLDRLEIGDLLARYCTALDRRDWDRLADVFTADAVCDYGALGTPTGVAEITGLVRGTLDTLDATQHLIGNVVVAVDGDTATAHCYLIAQHLREGTPGGETYLLGGTYEDVLLRTADGWRITHRTLDRLWATGNRDVVMRPS
jgi:ketosteroid isomerase-like protein